MSGTVPPPPPPPGGPQGPGGEPAHPVRRVESAYAPPPSFAPGSADGTTPASPADAATPPPAAAAPPPQTVHAPIPPAPGAGAAARPQPTAPPQPSAAPPPAARPVAPAPAPPQQQYGYTPQQYAYQQAAGPPPTTQSPSVGGGSTRRMSPGWIAFIALDVVLIVVAVVFAINVLGGSDVPRVEADDDPAAVAPPDAEDEPTSDAGDPAAEEAAGAQVAEFASPSQNITCQVYENEVSCGAAELNQQPAPVEGCDGTTGYVVTLDGSGDVALPCVAQGDKPTTAPDGMDQLAYGDARTEGDFTCTSEQDGMYCQHDPTGNGFSLARAGIGTY